MSAVFLNHLPHEITTMYIKIIFAFVFTAISTLATAAEFSFIDTHGKTQSLNQYRGRKVLLNLWATWCAPCLAEMPELEALSKSRNDLVVLGLAVDGQSATRVSQFAEKLHVTYPVIAGNTESAKQFKARGFPTSILFDTLGNQIFVKEGSTTQKEMENLLHDVSR